jgi:hypothetical protein
LGKETGLFLFALPFSLLSFLLTPPLLNLYGAGQAKASNSLALQNRNSFFHKGDKVSYFRRPMLLAQHHRILFITPLYPLIITLSLRGKILEEFTCY